MSSKREKLLDGVDAWCSFWRANPQRFVEDYLGIKLKMFQQIIIYYMNIFNFVMYLASRGQQLGSLNKKLLSNKFGKIGEG